MRPNLRWSGPKAQVVDISMLTYVIESFPVCRKAVMQASRDGKELAVYLCRMGTEFAAAW